MVATHSVELRTRAARRGEPEQLEELPLYHNGILERLAFERAALVSLSSLWKTRWIAESKLEALARSNGAPHGPYHPTVSLLVTVFVELDKQGLIELGPSVSWRHNEGYQGVWATKRATHCPGRGVSVRVFNCIAHGRSRIEDVVARFLEAYSKDPWTLATGAGIEEAIEYGFLTRQVWPKSGVSRWLSRIGLGNDVETVWIGDQRLAREAQQANRLQRKHVNEFRMRTLEVYEALRQGIVQGISKREGAAAHRVFQVPVMKKRLPAGQAN